MHEFTNRLAGEKSPYLLQHAHNPVDWYPWGEVAFAKAKAEDKPIFLSIGYATCHWCHVMERESFENEEIAALMNEAFVCIKVDREERPDIDNIYMAVCQMMTGQGGWPLTVVMTPDRQPFFSGTYFPAESRFGRLGMVQLVPRISKAWKEQREEILKSAGEITGVLAQQDSVSNAEPLSPELLEAGYGELMAQYDPHNGGFGRAPKFPTSHRLVYLMRYGHAQDKEDALKAVEHSLTAMRLGGVYDHVGLGFHRYSTDAGWRVPHFEKMLYDQAMLALTYTEAYELSGKEEFAEVAKEILTYVQRDMTAPGGGYYSAEDADSEGEEGLFYIWSAEELMSLLSDDEYTLVSKVWNIGKNGNFRDEASGKSTGQNILFLTEPLSSDQKKMLEPIRQKLFKHREKRIHPLKDTKVLTDWNGLMIAAFARAARVFGSDEYLQSAIVATEFIQNQMQSSGDRLWHRWREGEKAIGGQFEDYAFMIAALLELYETTLDLRFLESAVKYNVVLEALFWDKTVGGYFMTAVDAEELIVRPKNYYDGAIPSGNSMQMLNLLKLARLTGRSELEQRADETGKSFGAMLERSPSSSAQALIALQFAEDEPLEIVLVGKSGAEDTAAMLKTIRSVYRPGKVLLFKDVSTSDGTLEKLAPFTKEQGMVAGKATVYICRNFACDQPINSPGELKKKLE
ncbi:MAG: thioredoxin domain-containing protein [Kiritimatiellales bacterium]|nr:thioredoxin domain-containing protein [Kiritimatiellales bacterium]